MSNRHVVSIVGGGPGGLFAARLLKKQHPSWDVTLYERLPIDETFGFGVGLSAGTLRSVRAADPEVCDDMVEAAFAYSTAEFRLPTGTIEIPGFHSGVAIGRAELRRILSEHAQRAGVRIEIGEAPDVDALALKSDLVIAADGVSSAVRTRYAEHFGSDVETGRPYFIWCGSNARIDGAVFGPATTEFGTIVMHAYPYTEGLSTYVFETDRETLERGGFLDRTWASADESDEVALSLLSDAFSDVLGGTTLLGNRSRWTQFRTVTCQRWSRGNIVLLGDAAATAHPSIGSGTKLALESAIVLAEHLRDDSVNIDVALQKYEDVRRPSVERLQTLARRSHLWWESLEQRLELSPARLAASYLSRAGAVGLNDLQISAPGVATTAVADFASVRPDEVPEAGLDAWVISRPLETEGHSYDSRVVEAGSAQACEQRIDFDDPWGEDAAQVVQSTRLHLLGGAEGVRLIGSPNAAALRDRMAFGERVRRELGAVVEVEVTDDLLSEGVDGLIAGRVDLLVLTATTTGGMHADRTVADMSVTAEPKGDLVSATTGAGNSNVTTSIDSKE